MVVESYSENNMSASMIGRHLDHYWLGLASLDDLRTNTLESAAGMLVSQYAGSYAVPFHSMCQRADSVRLDIP